jgi:hypothetical protein
MSEWVLHCAVNQRHIRRSQPTRDAALKDACIQLLQGHAVNRIVGPNETINAKRVRDLVRKASTLVQSPLIKKMPKSIISAAHPELWGLRNGVQNPDSAFLPLFKLRRIGLAGDEQSRGISGKGA